MKQVVVAGCLVLGTLAPGGCAATGPDRLSGDRVAAMAEHELERENPRMAPGTLRCPDLAFEVGASVHCLRTTELSAGRVVKVRGTVEVTGVTGGGRLHVAMADMAEEFGLAGDFLAGGVRAWFVAQFHVRPIGVTCPYLRGEVGHQVGCRVQLGDGRREVAAIVTSVDPTEYRTTYDVRVRVD